MPSFKETKLYWKCKVARLNQLHKELQAKPDRFKIGYLRIPSSILNAYREGDLSFNEACSELNRLIQTNEEGQK